MDIKLNINDSHLDLSFTCPYCFNLGEPSVVTFDPTNSAWTETAHAVEIPCACNRCGCLFIFEVRLPHA